MKRVLILDALTVITRDGHCMVSINRFIGSSVFLFFDNIIVSAGNWLFWIIVTSLTAPSVVGQATVIIGLVTLLNTISQLGMEYPILKRTSTEGVHILGPSLLMAVAIACATLPLMSYITSFYHDSEREFVLIAALMISLYPINFVSRYTLLGISQARIISVIDTAGIVTKFVLAYLLLVTGWGAYGILTAILANFAIMSIAGILVLNKLVGIKFRPLKRHLYKSVLTESLVNTPSKFSGMLIFSLSVVLLGSYGINSSDIGRFYIALIITIVAGAMITNMAYMIIPASTVTKTDLSINGLRLGLSITSPFIAALISSPVLILSFLGPDYVKAAPLLTVLAIGILPFSVVFTSISKFNYLEKSKRIVILGIMQTAAFVISFILLVPLSGSMGAAYSIVIAFGSSFAVTTCWVEKRLLKYIANCVVAILAGTISGVAITFIVGQGLTANIFGAAIAICITSVVLLVLKNTTIEEMSSLIRIAFNQTIKRSES